MDSLQTGHISRPPAGISPEYEMGMGRTDSIIRKADAVQMDTLVREFIREMKIASGLDVQIVREAWDKASGAGKHTLGCTFRNGKLTVRLSSSVIRTRLAMQKDGIADEMNRILVADSIFTGCGDGPAPVREIILR